jgi:hippurate hydrolase
MPRISILLLLVLACWSTLTSAQPASGRDNSASHDSWLATQQEDLLALYKQLHSHPELSYQEVQTAARIAEELTKAGARVTSAVGKGGVVGLLQNGRGPVLLVRTDMDALPVREDTGLPYASKAIARDRQGREVGVMHACGHDIHMTCLVGTARWLNEHKALWNGIVVLVGQPAEEAIGGAREMLKDGLYLRFPKPDFAIALHCSANEPVGDVCYRPGPLLASSTSLSVTIRGKGGHGAWPHRTVDPIVLAALAVVDFQTIVSREIEPIQPAVLTVGSIHGGTKHNIIPDDVKLQLTLRAFSEKVRLQLVEGVERRCKALAEAHKSPPPLVEVEEYTPATINDAGLVQKVVPLLARAVGPDHVRPTDPVMGAEDFALYSEGNVPIMMYWLGTIAPERIARAKAEGIDLPALHSARYAPDAAPSITTGIKAMTGVVIGLLPPGPR